MVTIKYELGKSNSKGETPIYIKVRTKRQCKRIRFYMDASQNDLTAGGDIKNPHLDLAIQDTIQRYRHKLIDAGAAASQWDVEKVCRYLTTDVENKKEFSLDFIAFGREHVEKLRHEGREKTAKCYVSALNNFCRYLGNDSIDINRINKSMLLDYKNWFEQHAFGQRAFELYMSNLQSLHNLAKMYYNDEDDENLNIRLSPFKYIQFKRSAAERRSIEKRALSPKAIRYLYELPAETLSERASMARDAFLLSFALCGMNAIDMMQHEQSDGCREEHIEYYRRKTVGRTGKDAYISMNVHPMFMDIHRRLRGKRRTWCFGERYSSVDNFTHALNVGIRDAVDAAVKHYGVMFGLEPDTRRAEILRLLELPDYLTFYAARHSFATIAANDCHVPTEIVDRCLCHVVNSVAEQSYIKKDYRFTDETINAVVEVTLCK